MQIMPTGTTPSSTATYPFAVLSTPQPSTNSTGDLFMQTISKLTGISQDDLVSQLESGTSLGDILQSKNVTMSQVQQAMQAVQSQQNTQTAQISGRHHHHHHHGGGAPVSNAGDAATANAVLSALAGALNMTPADLAGQLNSGTGLAELAQQQGVSDDTLVTAVQNALENPSAYSASGTQSASQPVPPQVVDATA